MNEIEALKARKRRLDLVSFGVTLPLLVAFFEDAFFPRAGGSGLPLWVERYLVVWLVVFAAVNLVRYFAFRCPRCRKNLRRGGQHDLFRPLPNACRNCGLRLDNGELRLDGRESPVSDPVSPGTPTAKKGWFRFRACPHCSARFQSGNFCEDCGAGI